MVSFQRLFSVFAFSSLALSDEAPVSTDSPAGVRYIAAFVKSITGSIEFSSAVNGTVLVNVNLTNFPSTGGPFTYHVHELPLPPDGNCAGAKEHLNPYNGTQNATTPSAAEVGDLSGKHGDISGTSIETSYIDEFLSLNPENKAFIGNLSVVIHANNDTRLTCANITKEINVPTVTSTQNAANNMLAGYSSILISVAISCLSLLY